jgi:acyl-CoA thioesterase FadM
MPEFLEKQLGWFMKDFEITYKRQVKLGDKVLVYTKIKDWTKGVSTVAFRMELASTKKEVCSGSSAFALVDLNSGRNIPIPEWVIDRYSIKE